MMEFPAIHFLFVSFSVPKKIIYFKYLEAILLQINNISGAKFSKVRKTTILEKDILVCQTL